MMAALVGCALGAMTLASCGDDDSNNGGNTPETKSTPAYWTFEAGFGIDLAQNDATRDIFAVSVAYPENGTTVTKTGLELGTELVGTAKESPVAASVTLTGTKISFTSTTFGGNDEVVFTQAVKDTYQYPNTDAGEAKPSANFGYGYTLKVYDKSGNVITTKAEPFLYQHLKNLKKGFETLYPQTTSYNITVSKDGSVTVK